MLAAGLGVQMGNQSERVLPIHEQSQLIFPKQHLNHQKSDAVCFFADYSFAALYLHQMAELEGNRLCAGEPICVFPAVKLVSQRFGQSLFVAELVKVLRCLHKFVFNFAFYVV
jgi:hypothetical protein